MISLFTGVSITSVRKIAVARSELPEDQRLRRVPSEDDRWLKFGNYNNRKQVQFIVYTDLECVLRKTEPNKKEMLSYAYQ